MREPARTVIADTCVLQYLHQVGLFGLLPTLYGKVAVPQAVATELGRGREKGLRVPDPQAYDWLEVTAARVPTSLAIVRSLGPGEREALALAMQTEGALLLTDDLSARRQARRLGIRFTGTLGVLLRAKERGHVGALAPILGELRSRGFRLSERTRCEVLRLAGETP